MVQNKELIVEIKPRQLCELLLLPLVLGLKSEEGQVTQKDLWVWSGGEQKQAGSCENKMEFMRTGTLVSLITSTQDAVCDMQGNRHPSPTEPTTGFRESEGAEGKGKERGSLELSWLLPHTNQASRAATASGPTLDTWPLLHPHLPNLGQSSRGYPSPAQPHRRRILRTQPWLSEQAATETNSWVCFLPLTLCLTVLCFFNFLNYSRFTLLC